MFVDEVKRGNMTDIEMGEFLFDLIEQVGFDEDGELWVDFSSWNYLNICQIIRVCDYLGYECDCMFEDLDDPCYGIFIIYKKGRKEV